MRIMHVTNQYPPNHLGGDAIFVQNLSKAQTRNGHEVHVGFDRISTRYLVRNKEPIPAYHDSGARVYAIGGSLAGFVLSWRFGKLRRSLADMIEKVKPDIVHFHNASSFGYRGLHSLTRKLGCSTILTIHDTWAWDARRRTNLFIRLASGELRLSTRMRKRASRILSEFDLVVVPSRVMQSAVGECRGDFLLRRIPNGVPVSAKEAPPSGWELGTRQPPPKRTIILVGSLIREKGVTELPEIVSLFPRGEFVVVGDGPLRRRIRAQKDSPRIRMEGRLHPREVATLMENSWLLLSLSYFENSPLSLMEAMRHGLPFLARSVGGIPDLFDDGLPGHLVPQGSTPVDFARVIADLDESDDDWARRSQDGVRLFHSLYRIETCALSYDNAYSALGAC